MAIVQKKDANELGCALTDAGFEFTKMATSGGFLRSGNVTLFIGTQDERVDEVIGHIRKNCSRRMEIVPPVHASPVPVALSCLTEVPVGGAIVFVSDIERFEKM